MPYSGPEEMSRPQPPRSTSSVMVWVDAPDAASALQLGEQLDTLGTTEIVSIADGTWQVILRSRHERNRTVVAVAQTVRRWASTQGGRTARVRIATGIPSHP